MWVTWGWLYLASCNKNCESCRRFVLFQSFGEYTVHENMGQLLGRFDAKKGHMPNQNVNLLYNMSQNLLSYQRLFTPLPTYPFSLSGKKREK